MTEMTTSSAGGIENTNSQFAAPLDRLFDRVDSDKKLLAEGPAFEKVLLEELGQTGDTSPLGLSATRVLPGDMLRSAPPWESAEAGAIGILDGGLNQQSGALYTKAGEMSYAPHDVDSSAMAPASDGIHAEHHLRVVFDVEIFNTLNADVHDHGGQRLASSDGVNTPWTVDADNPLADDLISGADGRAPVFDLPMDHVFYNGEGRPIPLSSVMDDINVSLAAGCDQIILPNGAVFDYDPWAASADRANDSWIAANSSRGPGSFANGMVIEGELA